MQKQNETQVATEPDNTKHHYRNFLAITAALIVLIGLVILAIPSNKATAGDITVYKSPTCGCCGKWVDHLRDEGFRVKTVDRDDMGAVKSSAGVQPGLQSCHTAFVEGYIVEGHVPASDIKRMLQEKPNITGLAAPGMPMGSPGMESGHKDQYDVLAFDEAGRTTVYASH